MMLITGQLYIFQALLHLPSQVKIYELQIPTFFFVSAYLIN